MILRYRFFIIDLLRLAGSLNFSRVFNYLRMRWGLLLSNITGKVKVYGGPFSVSTEVASVCNLRCPECRVGQGLTRRSRPFMDRQTLKTILDAHRKHAFYANLYFQGEPMLNVQLAELIGIAKKKRYYTSISTNGQFLNQESCASLVNSGLDRIIISLDGLSEKSYLQYRKGGSFQRVLKGIEFLNLARKTLKKNNPLIVIQVLVNRHNEEEIPAVRNLAGKLGADLVQLKSMQVYNKENAGELLPQNSKYNRYQRKEKNRQNGLKSGRKKACYRLWSHAVYTSDAILVPCCYDKLPEFPLSEEGSFVERENWFSPEMYAFRERVMQRREKTGICCNCAL